MVAEGGVPFRRLSGVGNLGVPRALAWQTTPALGAPPSSSEKGSAFSDSPPDSGGWRLGAGVVIRQGQFFAPSLMLLPVVLQPSKLFVRPIERA